MGKVTCHMCELLLCLGKRHWLKEDIQEDTLTNTTIIDTLRFIVYVIASSSRQLTANDCKWAKIGLWKMNRALIIKSIIDNVFLNMDNIACNHPFFAVPLGKINPNFATPGDSGTVVYGTYLTEYSWAIVTYAD